MDKFRNINERNAIRLLAAADAISGAFVWRDSVQGEEYWETVYDNLELMAAELRRGNDDHNND